MQHRLLSDLTSHYSDQTLKITIGWMLKIQIGVIKHHLKVRRELRSSGLLPSE
jgi:hypothetical protein